MKNVLFCRVPEYAQNLSTLPAISARYWNREAEQIFASTGGRWGKSRRDYFPA